MGKLGLAQFETWAKANPRRYGKPCSVCTLPPDVLAVVHEAQVKGHGLSHLARYLVSIGHPDQNRQRLENHFLKGHHNAKAKRR